MTILQQFTLTFIPLFVAIDIIGTLPIYFSLTEGMSIKEKRIIIREGAITAIIIMLAFLFIGKGLLLALGITVADFMFAGGLLLLILSIDSMLNEHKQEASNKITLGIVPFGTPLIAGPASITTALVLIDTQGIWMTVICVILNVLLAWLILRSGEFIMRFVDINGMKAVSKISCLLLAAIGVMMMRRGIIEMIKSVGS